MSILPAFPTPRRPSTEMRYGFGAAAGVGAAQRASLGRGLAFALLLAASSLASAYVPLALHGPDWVEGTAAPAAR